MERLRERTRTKHFLTVTKYENEAPRVELPQRRALLFFPSQKYPQIRAALEVAINEIADFQRQASREEVNTNRQHPTKEYSFSIREHEVYEPVEHDDNTNHTTWEQTRTYYTTVFAFGGSPRVQHMSNYDLYDIVLHDVEKLLQEYT